MTEKTVEVDLSGIHLAIAMPCHTGTLPLPTALGVAETCSILGFKGMPHQLLNNYNHSLVDQARNELATDFMESDCNKILWIDSDIQFRAADAMRIIAFSTLHPMVGALYPIKSDDVKKFFVTFPDDEIRITEEGLVNVSMTGFGFHVADRSVYEELAKTCPTYMKNGRKIYDFFLTGRDKEGNPHGEDWWFWKRAEEAGYYLVIDPTIKLGHIGLKVYSIDPQLMFQELGTGYGNY